MKALVVALALVSAQPALACHRFHVWNYPTPQRCGFVALARHIPSPAPEERVSIEITITPELLENWAREDAIERLKAQSR